MAQKTQLTAIGIPGPLRSFWAYASKGKAFLYTKSNWQGATFYFEVYWRSISGIVYARLYNITDGAEVADSTLTTKSGTFTRSRSTALTLTDGKEYRIQFGVARVNTGEHFGGGLIAT